MSTQPTTQLVPVAKFVTGLRALSDTVFTDRSGVLDFLRANPVDPATLEPFMFWDSQHYTRNLIDKQKLYEVIAICWEVGQVSSIHNHKDQNCWMAVPIGRLMVQNYHVVQEDLGGQTCELSLTTQVEMNSTSPLAVDPSDPVHSVYNPREWQQRAVSLHIYSHPFDTCVVYSPEQRKCGEIKLHYTSVHGIPVKQ